MAWFCRLDKMNNNDILYIGITLQLQSVYLAGSRMDWTKCGLRGLDGRGCGEKWLDCLHTH